MRDRTQYGQLSRLLDTSADRFPNHVAARDVTGATQSYADLAQISDTLCTYLRRAGVSVGDRVGLCLPKSLASVACLFGVLKTGGAYVPVDAGAPSARNAYIFVDCKVSGIICIDDSVRSLCDALVSTQVDGIENISDILRCDQKVHYIRLSPPTNDESPPPAGLAYILYTSGSTGKPKGVMHTHASAMSFIDWCSDVFRPEPNDRFSSHAPFHFDLSILDLYVPVKHGASIVLIDEDLGKQPKRLAPYIAETGISVWYSTPSILRLLIEFGKLHELSMPALRIVLFAGEVFPLKYLRQLQTLWPRPAFYNLYGPTETNVCTYFRAPLLPESAPFDNLPIGTACSGDETRVVDQAGQFVALGSEGELVVCGGSVMTGYWNLPEHNKRAFFDAAGGQRWYRTGDIVREDKTFGYIYLGRRDRMVKRRGYRVELGEIEAALYRHDRISEVAVIANPDPDSGVNIHAFIAWSGQDRPSLIELKKFSAQNLPAYMIPDLFIFLDELPKTSTDKIAYEKLKEHQ